MSIYTESIERLINCLSKFPGIGRRSAERIVDYILRASKEEIKELSQAIINVKENIKFCKICNNLTEEDICKICKDPKRQKEIICVVEKPSDVLAIEKASSFWGTYYVLLGRISPLEGKGPNDLKLEGLWERIKKDNVKEIILATNPDTEGEATALYITNQLKDYPVKITRIGIGLPFGSHLEYMDPQTLMKAIESRKDIS